MNANLHEKFGLIELVRGKYHDKKLNQTLIIKQNYVELSGDDFQKQAVAMILYIYEGGKNRTELSSVFVEYAEENLELIESDEPQAVFDLNIEGNVLEVPTNEPYGEQTRTIELNRD